MAEQTTVVTQPDVTPEAFLADRERFWHTFTGLIALAVVLTVITLVLMAIFLL
jgi:hypothetical protein